MKKLFAIIVVSLISVASFAQSGKSVYNKYSEAKNVSAVYISPAMFKMMGKLPDMNVADDNVNLSAIVKALSGMYIINSGNVNINSNIKEDVEKMVRKGTYELIMEAKDDGEIVKMYTQGDEKIVTSFVLLTYEEEDCTFICFDGQIPREALEEAINNN